MAFEKSDVHGPAVYVCWRAFSHHVRALSETSGCHHVATFYVYASSLGMRLRDLSRPARVVHVHHPKTVA